MCLAIPAEVTELLPDNMARVSFDGVGKEVSVALVEDLAVGDYVIIHVGYALSKIDAGGGAPHAGTHRRARIGRVRGRVMKYVNEYRDGRLARSLAATIAGTVDPERRYHFMEFCGGHTHAISRYGIEDLLPDNVRMIHGPGCPVCVLPVGRIDAAIALAERPEVTLCTYGDLMRVPGSHGTSLLRAKAAGADIRMVYSTLDAMRIAETEPERRGGVLRHRLRDHDPADRARGPPRRAKGARQLHRVLQPRADAGGDPEHPGEPGRARARPRAHRRLHRSGACLAP